MGTCKDGREKRKVKALTWFSLVCESLQNGGNLGARKGIRSVKQEDLKNNIFLYICDGIYKAC